MGGVDQTLHHDYLAGYVADKHIAHSGVSITGTGLLSGGGDITTSREITLANADIDHAGISNRNWAAAGHTMDANLAMGGFDISGVANYTQNLTGGSTAVNWIVNGDTFSWIDNEFGDSTLQLSSDGAGAQRLKIDLMTQFTQGVTFDSTVAFTSGITAVSFKFPGTADWELKIAGTLAGLYSGLGDFFYGYDSAAFKGFVVYNGTGFEQYLFTQNGADWGGLSLYDVSSIGCTSLSVNGNTSLGATGGVSTTLTLRNSGVDVVLTTTTGLLTITGALKIIKSDGNTSGMALDRTSVINVTNNAGVIGGFTGLRFSLFGAGLGQAMIGVESTSGAGSGLSDMVFGVKASSGDSDVTEYLRIKGGGEIRLGVAANHTAWSAAGVQTMAGNARVKQKLVLDNADLGKGSTAPTQVIVGNYTAWEFTINDDSVVDAIVPKEWDTTEDININVCWAVNDTYSSDKEVKWQVDWSACPHDNTEAIDNPTHSGSDDSGDIDIPATAYFLREDTAVTIPAGSLALGDELGLILSRIPVTNDNPANDPVVIHLEVEFIANKLGTAL